MSRTVETEQLYALKGLRALRAAEKAGQSPGVWLEARAKRVSHATFRLERVALAFVLTADGQAKEAERVSGIGYPTEGRKQRRRRTSATKLKSLSDQRFNRLREELDRSAANVAPLAAAMLRAGREVGLRPTEWGRATREGSVLVVENAKATNGRAPGPVRKLGLGHLPPEVVAAVDLVLGYRDSSTVGWSQECKLAQQLVRRLSRKLWPRDKRWPTLYSARHQYSADLKAVATAVEVAAGMGHASDQTATLHYARKTVARSGASVARPVGDELTKVRSPGRSPGSKKAITPTAGDPSKYARGRSDQ